MRTCCSKDAGKLLSRFRASRISSDSKNRTATKFGNAKTDSECKGASEALPSASRCSLSNVSTIQSEQEPSTNWSESITVFMTFLLNSVLDFPQHVVIITFGGGVSSRELNILGYKFHASYIVNVSWTHAIQDVHTWWVDTASWYRTSRDSARLVWVGVGFSEEHIWSYSSQGLGHGHPVCKRKISTKEHIKKKEKENNSNTKTAGLRAVLWNRLQQLNARACDSNKSPKPPSQPTSKCPAERTCRTIAALEWWRACCCAGMVDAISTNWEPECRGSVCTPYWNRMTIDQT